MDSSSVHIPGRPGMTRRELIRLGGSLAAGAGGAMLLGEHASAGQPALHNRRVGTGRASSSTPTVGGRLRAGIANGGPSDTMDPTRAASGADFFRVESLFEGLTTTTPDVRTELLLAESIEPNADGTEWTIRLREGITFHDGKPLTVDDVIYTFTRTHEIQLVGRAATSVIDFDGIAVLDDLTIRVPLTAARAGFPDDLTQVRIVQSDAGDAAFTNPIGTGPFKFVSFTPGQTSLFARYESYWQDGRPYLDELEFTTIADGAARLNALLGGQVDAADQVLYTQAREYEDSDAVVINVSEPGNWVPMTMACDTGPFDDVRVRQAMRLIVDRDEMVANAQFGYGTVGNDLFGKGLEFYNDQLPQRTQDLDRARALLKEAGQEGLQISLDASSVAPGMLESATLFAEQARGAGVEVTVNNVPPGDYYGPRYLQYTFGQSSWVAGSVTGLMQASVGPDAVFNETHFSDPVFNDLFTQSQATLDQAKRAELLFECQRILYEDGGYIIWGLSPYIDALSPAVQGMLSTPTYPLGGGDFRSVSIES